MNILIIDDDYMKANTSKQSLQNIFGNIDFHIMQTGIDGINSILSTDYDFIILDMQFKFDKDELINEYCGLKVLDELYQNHKENIPVIICSSGKYIQKLDKYENVIGFIKYSGYDLTKQYEDILPQIRTALRKRDKKQEEQELEPDFYQ